MKDFNAFHFFTLTAKCSSKNTTQSGHQGALGMIYFFTLPIT
jgi:hypothetical protein